MCGRACNTINKWEGVAVRFRQNLKSSEEGKMSHYCLSESGRASKKKDELRTEENKGPYSQGYGFSSGHVWM